MKKIAKYTFIALILGSTAACNTISGIGQDVGSIGESVSETAEDAKGN